MSILFDEDKSITIYVETLPEEFQDLFIADGGTNIPKPLRSPWHDEEEKKRRGNKRDFMCNIWMSPVGASDMVFDDLVIRQIKEKFIKEPDFEGEICFEQDSYGRIENPEFYTDYGLNRLQWWGHLENGSPNPGHNYIISCDPSFGLGSSNSVAGIVDVNTRELVGLWVCPNTPPEKFADQVIAIAQWVGGVDDTLIIWESNGANGKNFGDRILWHHWPNIYTQTIEDGKYRKRQKRYGWRSSTTTKKHLIGELGVALSGGLSGNKNYTSIIIYSQDLLDELTDYVFLDGGDMTSSSKADLSSGARERHGDRVIAAALGVLGFKDQIEGKIENKKEPPRNSFEHRFREWQKQQEQRKYQQRRYLF